MVSEIEAPPRAATPVRTVELILGAAVYLSNPWIATDILAFIMMTIGVMMIEAVVVLGFSDLYFHFWLRILAHMQRMRVIVTVLDGSGAHHPKPGTPRLKAN